MTTNADTCVLHTSLHRLRQANACKDRYTHFRQAARALGYDGDTTPIPLTVLFTTNGLDDTLWALRAVLPQEETLRDRLAWLLACDYAEHVLPLFEARFPADSRPRNAIAVARRYALGQASEKEFRAAGDAARRRPDAAGFSLPALALPALAVQRLHRTPLDALGAASFGVREDEVGGPAA